MEFLNNQTTNAMKFILATALCLTVALGQAQTTFKYRRKRTIRRVMPAISVQWFITQVYKISLVGLVIDAVSGTMLFVGSEVQFIN